MLVTPVCKTLDMGGSALVPDVDLHVNQAFIYRFAPVSRFDALRYTVICNAVVPNGRIDLPFYSTVTQNGRL